MKQFSIFLLGIFIALVAAMGLIRKNIPAPQNNQYSQLHTTPNLILRKFIDKIDHVKDHKEKSQFDRWFRMWKEQSPLHTDTLNTPKNSLKSMISKKVHPTGKCISPYTRNQN